MTAGPVPIASPWPDPAALGAWTDLYELTMMAGYRAEGIDRERSTFELFVRKLPPHRSYLVFAGLEPAIETVLGLRFGRDQVDWLRSHPAFGRVAPGWFDDLLGFRFEGDIAAIPEGSIVFENEPLIRVEGPLAQCQLVETILIALLGYSTSAATKASRIVRAARGRAVVDLGARRGHGPQAGLLCARAAWIAGFAGTSLVEAARRLEIPAFGTMAHAWVQAFGDEAAAFAAFARHFDTPTLLVDTYDTDEGVRRAAAIEPAVGSIRIDSGDLDAASRSARAILDAAGRGSTRILASNDLDEHAIAGLVAVGAPIDGFGVGTDLITVRDAPAIAMVYKLVERSGQGRIKRAAGKASYPFGKQVWRRRDADGRPIGDLVARLDESPGGEPMLLPIVRDGALTRPWPSLADVRRRAEADADRLPEVLLGLEPGPSYPVRFSDRLEADRRELLGEG